MQFIPDVAHARFGGWSTKAPLPPGVRPPEVKAADYAYAYLKELIVTLELAPQSIITENEIAAATGVSRTPVREAFSRLQSEQLLRLIPHRGAVVSEITLRSIHEQAQTRVVLESYGVEWVCEHEVPIAERLFALVESQRSIYEDDPDRIVDMVLTDKEFHWTLVRATGNTEFAQLYNSIHDRQVRIGIAMFQAVESRRCSAIHQHEEIAQAIAEFDVETAKSLLKSHLVDSLSEVSGIFTN
ncbi:DNA-binding GntR family transcriptional regulator [Leucobacter luti]|uniref:GntR family transcriptional regulator n=1 Tax=Leucobacter luti TaxID=340320 RepID=UPI001046413F|nr:GntR family transcriptional regulator [Leucobacter luti]MCW2289553.1 DNA-binding GntR family transcriptional regulator [Leucobacter luti]TCK37725.1 DNA-binding GntR family transcriptional regulator [Leucobacter luti]